MSRRLDVVRDAFRAYETGDRRLLERCLSEHLQFFSPADPAGEQVIVTYEATTTEGSRFRNTEVLTLDADDRIARVEVYFGWNL